MFDRRLVGCVTTVVLVFLSLAQAGTEKAKPRPKQLLLENARHQIAELYAASALDAKLERLGRLKAFLKTEDEKPVRSEDNGEVERSIAAGNMSIYFGKIDEKRFSKKQCADYRDRIYFAVHPKQDPPRHVPAEAQLALDVLDNLCTK